MKLTHTNNLLKMNVHVKQDDLSCTALISTNQHTGNICIVVFPNQTESRTNHSLKMIIVAYNYTDRVISKRVVGICQT